MTRNEPEQVKLRRDQNTLIIVGTGTIVFGLWSFVKAFGVIFSRRTQIVSEIIEDGMQNNYDFSDVPEGMIIKIMLLFVGIALAADMVARLYVGLSAIAAGRGKRKSILYIIITAIMILFSLMTLISVQYSSVEADHISLNGVGQEGSLSAIIIELTSIIMMTEMLAAAIRVRKLTRQGRRGKE